MLLNVNFTARTITTCVVVTGPGREAIAKLGFTTEPLPANELQVSGKATLLNLPPFHRVPTQGLAFTNLIEILTAPNDASQLAGTVIHKAHGIVHLGEAPFCHNLQDRPFKQMSDSPDPADLKAAIFLVALQAYRLGTVEPEQDQPSEVRALTLEDL